METLPQTVSHYRVIEKLGGADCCFTESQTGKPREILSVAPHGIDTLTLSRDDRLMYFSVVAREADIWLAILE